MPPLRLLISSLVFFSLAAVARAQDDPFGGPDPFGASGTATSTAANEQEAPTTPLASQLLEHSRRGSIQRAMAISSLVRTGRWDEADQLLSSAAALDTPTLAAMFDEIGPALFLRMKQSEQIGDAGKTTLDQMASAAKAAAESSEIIRQAIDGLDAPSVDKRLAATRTLIHGGATAVAELAAAAVSSSPLAPRDIILRALIEFDDFGVSALQQLALYGTPEVRNRALQALGWIDRKGNLPAFASAYYAADASDAEKRTAKLQLERLMNQLPSRTDAIRILEENFSLQKAEAKRTDNDDQTVVVWIVGEDGQTVSAKSTQAMLAAYRKAADAGNRLRRIKDLPDDLTNAVLSSDMAYRMMVDPDWGDPDQINEIRDSYGSASSAASLSAAIARASQAGDHPATIGLLRLIDPANATENDRMALLNSHGATPTPLVMAVNNSIPQVRYEAATTAAILGGSMPYSGSSMVRKTLAEMSLLGDQPTAILVETRPEVVVRVETILSRLGYATCVVQSVRQLQRVIDRGGDLRLILSRIELSDRSPVEMVDLVRRVPRGRDLPIIFYGPEDPALMWKRWDAPTALIDMPSSAAGLYDTLESVRRNRRLPALTVIDRQHYRETAGLKPSS